MVMSALVLGVVTLLVGCVWTAVRYRRAHTVVMPQIAARETQLFEYPVREHYEASEAA
jgi:hypothetical protein